MEDVFVRKDHAISLNSHSQPAWLQTNWCINWVLMRVIDAVKETIAGVSSALWRRANARNVSYCLFHDVYPSSTLSWYTSLSSASPTQLPSSLESWRYTVCLQTCRLFPHLEDKVEFFDVGTPVTNTYYIATPRGEMYGLDHNKVHVWYGNSMDIGALSVQSSPVQPSPVQSSPEFNDHFSYYWLYITI